MAHSKPKNGFTPIVLLLAIVFFGSLIIIAINLNKKSPYVPNQQPSTRKNLDKMSSSSSEPNTSLQTKIAYIKKASASETSVVIKTLDLNEEIDTKIPIRWLDPKATWCQGFDWSPDGTKILATPDQIITYDLNTKKLNPIQNFPNGSVSVYQWGQDSKSIYFTRSLNGTWIYDFVSSSSKQISKYPILGQYLSYSLSHDSKNIVLNKDSGKKDKFGNPINIGIVLNVESGEETEIALPANASTKNPFIKNVAWSPDNSHLAYVYETNANDNMDTISKLYRHIGIFNINSKTSEELKLPFLSVNYPVYSPNGEYLIFENDDSGQELWISNKDGSNPRKIADKPVDFYKNPSWSADSKSIVYGNIGKGVFIVNINGSNRKTISEDGSCPIISPK